MISGARRYTVKKGITSQIPSTSVSSSTGSPSPEVGVMKTKDAPQNGNYDAYDFASL
jgi:hypothetical protein